MIPDPFEILGLHPRFALDPITLEKAYLSRVARLHPDAEGMEDNHNAAASLNDARTLLADPERRAAALLERLGGPSASTDKGLPTGFLAEMMELRETIESDLRSDPLQARAKWRAWADKHRSEYIERVGTMFDRLSAPPQHSDLKAIRVHLNAWRYIERLIEQLSNE